MWCGLYIIKNTSTKYEINSTWLHFDRTAHNHGEKQCLRKHSHLGGCYLAVMHATNKNARGVSNNIQRTTYER